MRYFSIGQNPILDIVWHPLDDVLKENVQILNNFRYLYYLLKFKKRFRDLLWIRVREPKIREKYSSEHLLKLLEKDDLEKVLETW